MTTLLYIVGTVSLIFCGLAVFFAVKNKFVTSLICWWFAGITNLAAMLV